MGSKFDERIYGSPSLEPVTPSEVAKKTGVTYKDGSACSYAFGFDKEGCGVHELW